MSETNTQNTCSSANICKKYKSTTEPVLTKHRSGHACVPHPMVVNKHCRCVKKIVK